MTQVAMSKPQFKSFEAFYPFYLGEHAQPNNRRLHFVGSSMALACVLFALFKWDFWYLLAAPICGYGMAWIGHFFIEHNRPATFSHPWYSLRGDWQMWWDILRGRMDF